MRITKDAQVRKEEILDVAQRLFHQKGYKQTSIEDILREIGIARGTLYYHFKTKEDILSAMINRQIEQRERALRRIADNKALSAVEKLYEFIQFQAHSGTLAEGLHEKENFELHQRSFQQSLFRYAPILTEIVEQGVDSGEFSTPYPSECVELLLCASQLHDPGVFTWTPEEDQRKKEASFWMLEKTLDLSPEARKRLYELARISAKRKKTEETETENE